MKRTLQSFGSIFLVVVAIFVASFFMTSNALAETFSEEVQSIEVSGYGNLSVSMTATSRNNTSLERVEESGVNLTNEEVTYLVFQWSELKALVFTFSVGAGDYDYSMAVDYVNSETILPSISSVDQEDSLLTDAATSRTRTVTFTYNIDSSSTASVGTTVAKGYDFGLYRFRISYTYDSTDAGTEVTISKDFYVAVLPDDINTIEIPENLSLSYTITSSNSLLDAFTFSLSGSTFKYCNPAYLTWSVEGEDVNLQQYCYNKTMQEIAQYSSFSTVKNSWGTPTGTTFFFDSEGIEGTWTVTLTVSDTNGDVLEAYTATVSTIKEGTTSTLWIVLVSVFGSIVGLGLILFLLVYIRKKKEGVW